METNEYLSLIYLTLVGCFILLAIIGFGIGYIIKKLDNLNVKLK